MSSRPGPTFEPRRCDGCGQPMFGTRSKRFCDARCRATAARARKRKQMRTIIETLKHAIAELEELVGRE